MSREVVDAFDEIFWNVGMCDEQQLSCVDVGAEENL